MVATPKAVKRRNRTVSKTARDTFRNGLRPLTDRFLKYTDQRSISPGPDGTAWGNVIGGLLYRKANSANELGVSLGRCRGGLLGFLRPEPAFLGLLGRYAYRCSTSGWGSPARHCAPLRIVVAVAGRSRWAAATAITATSIWGISVVPNIVSPAAAGEGYKRAGNKQDCRTEKE